MRELADTALVAAARGGDREAMARLLADHLPMIYNIVGRALAGHPDVDDVVQETMLRAVQSLPSLRDPERFRSWLVAIAIRQIRDRARRAATARVRPWEETAPDQADPDADFVDDAITRLQLTAERDTMLAAIRWLDAEDRRVLALWWQELAGTLSRAEISGALGLTVAHTGVRIQRMRGHLLRARLILAAWQSTPRCPGLAEAARGWDGSGESRWVKRLHRHVRDCPQCLAAGRLPAPAETALAHIGLLPISAGLLHGALSAAHGAGAGIAASTAAGAAAHSSWWSRLVEYATAKPALTVTTGAGVAAAVTAAVFLLPGPESSPPVVPPVAGASATPSSGTPSAPTTTPSATPAAVIAIYLSPTGSDAGDGSSAKPYASLAKAVSVVRPGQTIVARGGTYRPSKAVSVSTDGTAQKRITLTNAPGERPVFDAARIAAGAWFITQTADFWTVRGLEIRSAPSHAYVCRACRGVVFHRMSIHDNRGIGLLLRDAGTTDNQVLDGDFYRNHDNGAADGLAFKYGSGTGNVVRGCRFWGNVDDGLDLHEFTSPVTIDRSWSFGNGVDLWHDPAAAVPGAGNGFRLGGGDPAPAVAHVVTNSAAWDNTGYGFTESANRGGLQVTSNTAYRNGKDGFAFFYSASTFRHNLALANNRDAVLAETAIEDGNSWNQTGWTTSVLRETDPRTAQAARRVDGGLPATAFLTNGHDSTIGAPMTE
jgi:RNA polymerase sigma factor (sigma-70 family)